MSITDLPDRPSDPQKTDASKVTPKSLPDSPPPEAYKPRFDLTKLRVAQNFEAAIGAEKLILDVSVDKPSKQIFVRVHRSLEFQLETAVLVLDEKRETYIVDPSLWPTLGKHIKRVVLFTAITRSGVIFLWPVKLPDEDGKHNSWHKSLLNAALIAKEEWIRVESNHSLKGYECTKMQVPLGEPTWPNITFQQLFDIAFKDRFINSLDHPILKALRGEV